MDSVAQLTKKEAELLASIRTLRPGARERVQRYVELLREDRGVRSPDPEKAARLGLPGPPMWHMAPDEVKELDAYQKACDEASRDA